MTCRRVAALCVSRTSVYKTIPGVDPYDKVRDCRTFRGSCPVVCHPPCRLWSAHCRHQAKAPEDEKDMTLWVCEVLKKNGGILEQPANSRLFRAAGLPTPGKYSDLDLWSAEVWQAWWGHPVSKRTWLAFSRIDPSEVVFPFRLHDRRGDKQRWNKLSKRKREATTPEMANWMVNIARTVT